jgi:hypothetical protein
MLLLPRGTICTSRLLGHVVVAIVLFVPAMKILTVAVFVLLHYCSAGKSTIRYATFMTIGVIAAELATNSLTDSLWEANNAGKTYAQVDWSKFDPPDDDDDEEGGDDDEEEDDDE